MRVILVCLSYALAGSTVALAQTAEQPAQKKESRSAQIKQQRPTGLPNPILPPRAEKARQVTINQVVRETGGKVIGAKHVDVQGRQLNQIKVLLPNGRVITDQRLFDEKGRSVDTVHQPEADSDPGRKR
jgi:hypothetical protein